MIMNKINKFLDWAVTTVAVIVLVLIFVMKHGSKETNRGAIDQYKAPKPSVMAPSPSPSLKSLELAPIASNEILELEANNTVLIKGVIDDQSIANASQKLIQASHRVSKKGTIYLVLDTPGGDIVAGNQFIETAQALPQKIKTVTIFAASMGFQIVEHMDERLIVRSGTLMSHKARGGISGEMPGQIQSRLNFWMQIIDRLDKEDAARVGLSLEDYRAKTANEWWMDGEQSIKEKAADGIVQVHCGESMSGSHKQTFNTFFGPVTVEFSDCPMVQGPLSIDFGAANVEQKRQLIEYFDEMFNRKADFVNNYITGNKQNLIYFK